MPPKEARVWLSQHRCLLLTLCVACGLVMILQRFTPPHTASLETEVLEGLVQGVISANKENHRLSLVQQQHSKELAILRTQLKSLDDERLQLQRRHQDLRTQIHANRLTPSSGTPHPSTPAQPTPKVTSSTAAVAPRDILQELPGCGGAASLVAQAPVTQPQESSERALSLCPRYNWVPLPAQQRSRRLFVGALVANEERLIYELLAAETLGLVSAFAFVESNMTLDGKAYPRELRFCQGNSADGKWLKELFSANGAAVSIGAYTDMTDAKRDELEYLIRETLAEVWVKQGMTHNDVGILIDADETFTRQFLEAMKICDVPGFQLQSQNPCRKPKMVSNTLIMEGYFDCVWAREHNRGFHPDAIIGQCLEALNPDIDNSQVKRKWDWHVSGGVDRVEQDGLWNLADLKFRAGASPLMDKLVTGGEWPTAFHFHNFWGADSQGAKALQFKYAAYGHSLGDTKGMELEDIAAVFKDVAFMIRCFKGAQDEARSTKHLEPEFWLTHKYNNTELREEFPVPQLFFTKPELVARYFLGKTRPKGTQGLPKRVPPILVGRP